MSTVTESQRKIKLIHLRLKEVDAKIERLFLIRRELTTLLLSETGKYQAALREPDLAEQGAAAVAEAERVCGVSE